jgi:putative nucleotidyltransferase with HDIG domain
MDTENVELVILDPPSEEEGVNAVKYLHNDYPDIPIIFLGKTANRDYKLKILREGAHDYLLKNKLKKGLLSHIVSHAFDSYSIKGEMLQSTLTKLRQSLDGTIEAISRTVEKRDPYTGGHQRRVSDLARSIGQELGLSVKQIDCIRMSGVIHDIGKIYVPAEILSKPGRLTDIEFDLIKTHTQVGYEILKDIEFPWPIADIVLQHHERINGTGYPNGLKSGDLIIEVKIMSVADVVEAMASHRPYRPSRGVENALNEINKNKGILFDPAVVDACIKLFKDGYTFT